MDRFVGRNKGVVTGRGIASSFLPIARDSFLAMTLRLPVIARSRRESERKGDEAITEYLKIL